MDAGCCKISRSAEMVFVFAIIVLVCPAVLVDAVVVVAATSVVVVDFIAVPAAFAFIAMYLGGRRGRVRAGGCPCGVE